MAEGDCDVESSSLGSWRRTRRNVLAAGGLFAGAALSQLGASKANAGNGKGNNGNGNGNGGSGGSACFLRGTRLLTPSGERKVEELQIGGLVTTLRGEAKPITWIGRRVYRRLTDSKHPDGVLSVRVAKGALGPDAPHCDLFISQQHALWVDGLFIKAIDLVNGSSITVHSAAAEHSEIEYLHVKLAQHDVIFAEGAPSETLLVHSGNVERFDNFAEYLRLFGEDAADEVCCAPIAFGNGRERLMSRLRSAVSPLVDCRNEFDKARDRITELAE
jgi:Hint domain